MTSKILKALLDALTSLKLAIVCLALLMVLVIACTLAQVDLGTFGAVDVYMRSYVVWWKPGGATMSIPVLPGGSVVGGVLIVNLALAQIRRLTWSWSKSGLWILHAGLILLVLGEFISGMMQVDARMSIETGQSANYVERPREIEVAIIDSGDAKMDDEYGIPESLLQPGATVAVPGTPIAAKVVKFFRNADLAGRKEGDPPAEATAGIGGQITVKPLPPVASDEERDTPAALVEFTADGKSYGKFWLSLTLGAPQMFAHGGRQYRLEMRQRREYLPYTLTLQKFSHDVYAGTDIPKNFSSLVRLINPSDGEDRTVLIYMNQPLRYMGRTFYQASFGKNDTLTILQVVQNPGWMLPYVSCALVTLGLLVHFGVTLARTQRKRNRREAKGADGPAGSEPAAAENTAAGAA